MEKIAIFGATSAIATETARLFARDGATLALIARDVDKLERLAEDLKVRGARDVMVLPFDAKDVDGHGEMVKSTISTLQGLDRVLIAHGSLPDQPACEESWAATEEAFIVNMLSPIRLVSELAVYFEEQGRGNITVISSVAGDRGRKSNYVYGTSKGALSTFLQGVRNRLAKKGVSVTTIKPGFVDTPMTGHIPKTKLFASAEAVGARIYKAMKAGEDVVYTPLIWFAIMTIITSIPERIFKRLSL